MPRQMLMVKPEQIIKQQQIPQRCSHRNHLRLDQLSCGFEAEVTHCYLYESASHGIDRLKRRSGRGRRDLFRKSLIWANFVREEGGVEEEIVGSQQSIFMCEAIMTDCKTPSMNQMIQFSFYNKIKERRLFAKLKSGYKKIYRIN